MASIKFAIDFDSSITNIYKLGSGLVLSEPPLWRLKIMPLAKLRL